LSPSKILGFFSKGPSCGGAASTHYWLSPQDNLIVATMEQRWPYSPETEEALKPVIYGAMEK
jgi:hypothetical protein